MSMKELGIYIHWPFCVSKCPYCDFNVHVRDRINHEQWAQSYVQAVEYYADLMPVGLCARSILVEGRLL